MAEGRGATRFVKGAGSGGAELDRHRLRLLLLHVGDQDREPTGCSEEGDLTVPDAKALQSVAEKFAEDLPLPA